MKKTLLAVVLAATAATAAAAEHVRYPDRFRDWRHVKSMVINQGHPLYEAVGGMHHIYANQKALAGYRSGKFPDGALIVFDLFEAVDKDHAVAEGVRKAVVVMEKNRGKFKQTEGWGYEVFSGSTKKGTLGAKAAAECHACHTQQKAKDFVFSALRD